jgi:tRNA threonylcarbamoyladenosine biosynthesis protein TsaB
VISLVIDASTYRGTVAVFRDSVVVSSAHAVMRGAHSEALMPAVAETLSKAGVSVGDLGRVVCGEGPGSFTSLRIAASIAKGICLGRGIPLYAVSSLALAAAGAADRAAPGNPATFVVTIDALRDEWYVAPFVRDQTGTLVQRSPMSLVAKADLDDYAAAIGPVVAQAEPDAAACALLFAEMERRGPVDLDRWEPSYGRLAEAQVKWEAAHGRPLKV